MDETILHKAYGELVKKRNFPALLKGSRVGKLADTVSGIDLRERVILHARAYKRS